jgi:hypothetical protein
MNMIGHAIRLYEHIDGLWPRTALEQEMDKWQRIWNEYCEKLRQHQHSFHTFDMNRYRTFRYIVRLAVERIQNRLAEIEILEPHFSAVANGSTLAE